MKRLYDYLVEDFKLSKHTKLDSYIFSIDDFNAVQPNKTGDSCLILAYTTAVKPHLEIDLGMYRILDNNKVEFWYTQYSDESRSKATKLTTNYYCFSYDLYTFILLFGDDAIKMLKTLYVNTNAKIDINKITTFVHDEPVQILKQKNEEYIPYTKYEVYKMLDTIKDDEKFDNTFI